TQRTDEQEFEGLALGELGQSPTDERRPFDDPGDEEQMPKERRCLPGLRDSKQPGGTQKKSEMGNHCAAEGLLAPGGEHREGKEGCNHQEPWTGPPLIPSSGPDLR